MSVPAQSKNITSGLPPGTTTNPDLTGWAGLQGQIRAGEGQSFGFRFHEA
jgi:hypothetical protein